ncbi:Uncharacterised protein [uncultured archaeon]|nr:Uncharacterised protein [uncultured archaeon]
MGGYAICHELYLTLETFLNLSVEKYTYKASGGIIFMILMISD